MKTFAMFSRTLVPAVLALFVVVGCGGEGTTVDTKPTAPPITAENAKDLSKDINAGAGGMKSPGVGTPKIAK